MSPAPAGLYALEHEPYDEHAPVVVLVHGTLDRSASFNRVVAGLSDLWVIVYDRRGYGRSAGLAPSSSLDAQVDDLLAVLDGRRATFVGHSFGGVVALTAAARHPEQCAAAAVYESPMPWMPWWPAGSSGAEVIDAARTGGPGVAAETFIRRVGGDASWDDLPAPTQDARRAEGAVMLADFDALGGLTEAPFDLAGLPFPLVVGYGSDSEDYHRVAAERIGQAAGVEPVRFDGAGHLAHVTHPGPFAALVRQAVAAGKA